MRELEVGPGRAPLRVEDVSGIGVLIVMGGDGTMRTMASLASRAGTPVYHYPLGNENLFAREFGMDRGYGKLARAVAAGQVSRVDIGVCNGEDFMLMVSIGVDANIVHRLSAVRKGPTSHIGYIGPMVCELVRTVVPEVRVEADGELLADGERGLLVVANSRQYALRLDPARRAEMRDGLLDVVFMPHRGRAGLIMWAGRILAGSHLAHPLCRSVRASRVVVTSTDGRRLRYQMDGDAPGEVGAGDGMRVELGVRAGALGVLEVQARG